MVDNFFPYSQKQLNFDKPVEIVFQSDEGNANTMLGKTAFYDPENMQVVLFVDNRHPKDIMRSLSHELVHHAQNCRGDFQSSCEKEGGDQACAEDMGPGYAQRDPHLRNMEREAYTKGNLIFRDFEDLIKTGKINIEIDFSESGEPKMSLKEWKNNEINTKLMKKWGFLKESKEVSESFASEKGGEASFFADVPGEWGTDAVEDQPELDFIFSAADPEVKEQFMLAAADALQAYDRAARKGDPSAEKLLGRIKQAWLKFSGHAKRAQASGKFGPNVKNLEPTMGDLEEGCGDVDYREEDELEERVVGGKISVREAKEMTRRIIERIRKEAK